MFIYYGVFILFVHSCLWLWWACLVEVVMFLSCLFTAVCVRWACLVEVVMFLSCLFTAVFVRWAHLVEIVMFLSCLFTAVCDCDGPAWWRLSCFYLVCSQLFVTGMGVPGGGCHVFILFVHSCLWLRWAHLVEVVMFLSCFFTAVCDCDGRAWWRLSCFYLVCSQLFVCDGPAWWRL